jgi:hypothetical protein
MKILKTSLKEMLETGQIGELKLDLSHEEVREIMGEPPLWGGRSLKYKKRDAKEANDAPLWRYDDLEYSFSPLLYIMLEFEHDNSSLPENIQIDEWFLSTQTALETVKKYLDEQKFQYSIKHLASDLTTVEICINQKTIAFRFLEELFIGLTITKNE